MSNSFEFSEEEEDEKELKGFWNILIVDDEEDVHVATRLALKHFIYEGKGLTLHHAHSGAQAVDFMAKTQDTAIVFMDVIMETDTAGLDAIQKIRETNKKARIIIRTGQPGQVPEAKVVVEYDIDAYKEKSELTANKLFSTIVSSLRTYDTLKHLEEAYTAIEAIVEDNEERLQIMTKGLDVLRRVIQVSIVNAPLKTQLKHILNTLVSIEQVECGVVLYNGKEYTNCGSKLLKKLASDIGVSTIKHDGQRFKVLAVVLECRNKEVGKIVVCFSQEKGDRSDVLLSIMVMIGYVTSGMAQREMLINSLYEEERKDPFSLLPIV